MSSDAIPFIRFDTAALPPHGRLDAWRDGLGHTFDIQLPAASAAADLAVTMTSWRLGELVLASGHLSAQTLVRPQRRCLEDGIDHILIALIDADVGAELDAEGRTIRVPSGRLVVTDLARPLALAHAGCDSVALFVPRRVMDELLPPGMDLHGLVPQGPFAVLASAHLRALASLLPEACGSEAPHLAKAAAQLVAASLAPTPEALAQHDGAYDETLRRQVCGHIEAHLTDPALSAAQLCEAFKLSRASLYRLFEPLDGVASEIKRRRLLRAHAALAAGEDDGAVHRIAERFGFGSASYFCRAFREQFGYPPGDVVPPSRTDDLASPPQGRRALQAWLQTH